MRHAVLTSTFTNEINGFDRHDTLTAQSLSKAHRKPRGAVACGVLVAIGIALCFPTAAGSTNSKEYIDYKTYSLYLLDFNYKEYKCLAALYGKESAWNPKAVNGSHYGIPQGRSIYLSTLNGYDQVQWGLDYIGHRYGEPCKAWKHWLRYGWH